MLTDAIKSLIRDEQSRQSGRFIEGVELEAYLGRLDEHAEVEDDVADGRCRGFVAFYCNDTVSKRAFITLVMVAPEDRSTGLGRTLVTRVLGVCRGRGFATCQLKVRDDNAAALAMYQSLGFATIERRGDRHLMELAL